MAIHSGTFEGLSASWQRLRAWIEDAGLQRASDLWEVYAVGPGDTPDPSAWRTELYQPLVET